MIFRLRKEQMVDKVERDGLVAVIISPGYGAGWSTWADDSEKALFSPEIVEWIEAGKPGLDPDDCWKELDIFQEYGYTGGLRDVVIVWLPKGTQFLVDEYDGNETLRIISPTIGYIA
jgi:hypothetical protein